MSGETNKLVNLTKQISNNFEPSEYDSIVATGEQASCALTAAMMTRAGGLVSVAGGGDTVAALNNAGASGGFSYISVAGGAFLEWIEGKVLPGIQVLND